MTLIRDEGCRCMPQFRSFLPYRHLIRYRWFHASVSRNVAPLDGPARDRRSTHAAYGNARGRSDRHRHDPSCLDGTPAAICPLCPRAHAAAGPRTGSSRLGSKRPCRPRQELRTRRSARLSRRKAPRSRRPPGSAFDAATVPDPSSQSPQPRHDATFVHGQCIDSSHHQHPFSIMNRIGQRTRCRSRHAVAGDSGGLSRHSGGSTPADQG